jgi:TPP-dependent trihydroxycyclohexane-1,2-dione (THcHDO) dehydratase
MSTCRIARRIASMTQPQNASSHTVCSQTLERKVLDYPCQFFSHRGGGQRLGDIQ